MRGVIILRRWKNPPQDSTQKTLKEEMSRYARHDRKEKRRFLGLKPSVASSSGNDELISEVCSDFGSDAAPVLVGTRDGCSFCFAVCSWR